MKKVLIIVTYFGKLPDYFYSWLLTVKHNPTIDFLFVSDQPTILTGVNNIKPLFISIKDFQTLIEIKLGSKVCDLKPYKICDFRPAFGLIFSDYLKTYAYWGHSDIDVIYGDLSFFFTQTNALKFDKVFQFGHLTLYKNNNNTNNLFKSNNGIFNYKEVFSTTLNFAFDERSGINIIFENEKFSALDNKFLLNATRSSKDDIFEETEYFKNFSSQLFIWEAGKIFQIYFINKTFIKKEFIYLHFQKRTPTLNVTEFKSLKLTRFLFSSDSIVSYETDPRFLLSKYPNNISFTLFFFKNLFYIIKKVISFLNFSTPKKILFLRQQFGRFFL